MKRMEIATYLLENGFTLKGDVLTKVVQQKTGEMIVNGKRQVQVQKVEIKITYISNGWIGESEENSKETSQWNLSVNGVDQGDFVVESLEDFKKFFKV